MRFDESEQFSAEEIDELAKSPIRSDWYQPQPVRIEDELLRREEIKNEDLLQDISLKRWTLIILLVFLGLETVLVFAFAFFQATNQFGFYLEEWSFKLLVSATITQVYLMLRIAVQYLFPKK